MKIFKVLFRLGVTVLIFAVVLSGSIMLDIYKNKQAGNDASSFVGQDSDIFIDKNTIVRQEVFYTLSKRVVSTTKAADKDLYGLDIEGLKSLGWDAFRSDVGQIVIFKEEEALMPEDEEKRHIKIHDGKLAIFAGPSTAEGQLISPLGIDPNYLDPEWQTMLQEGGIDFDNIEDLYLALESLDEY